MTFTVTLSAAQTTPVSVQYFSSISTPDYTSNAGTLTFNPGESTKTITIQTNTDAVADPNETVTMTLQQPTGATIADAIAVGTIVDVPAPTGPTLSINDVTVNEGGNALFTITLSQAPAAGQTVTVDYATQNGTAVNGADYLGKTGKVTFFAGQTTASVVVEVHDDIDQEGVENLKLNLLNAVGATIIKSSGAVTIDASDATGNPPPGSLAFTAVATGQICTASRTWRDRTAWIISRTCSPPSSVRQRMKKPVARWSSTCRRSPATSARPCCVSRRNSFGMRLRP